MEVEWGYSRGCPKKKVQEVVKFELGESMQGVGKLVIVLRKKLGLEYQKYFLVLEECL